MAKQEESSRELIEPGSALSRRKLVAAGAWSVPAVMFATAAPAVSASDGSGGTAVLTVYMMRAGEVKETAVRWKGSESKAPGFRFFSSGKVDKAWATIVFEPTEPDGEAISPSDIFHIYDGLALAKASPADGKYTFGFNVSLSANGHKGITIRSSAKANGTYTVTFGEGEGQSTGKISISSAQALAAADRLVTFREGTPIP